MSPPGRKPTAGSSGSGERENCREPPRTLGTRHWPGGIRRERGAAAAKSYEAAWQERLQSFHWALVIFLKDVHKQRAESDGKISELQAQLQQAKKLLADKGYQFPESAPPKTVPRFEYGRKVVAGSRADSEKIGGSSSGGVLMTKKRGFRPLAEKTGVMEESSKSDSNKIEPMAGSSKSGGTSTFGTMRRSSLHASFPSLKSSSVPLTSEEAPCACRRCKKIFSNRGYFEQHWHAVHEPFRFQCELCPKQVPFWSQLNRHMVAVHGCQVRRQCAYCGEQFDTLREFEQHQRYDHGIARAQIIYQCPFCDTDTDSKAPA